MAFDMRAFVVAAAAVLLAGCGGGASGVSTLPVPVKHAGSVAVASPSPAGTLYVGDVTKVYAFPLSGDGTLAPDRTIVPEPTDNTHSLSYGGLATGTDGSLFVLDNYFIGPANNQTEFCRVIQYGPTDSGSPNAPEYYPDPNFETASQGEGIARNSQAGFDFAFRNGGAGGPYGVYRFGDSGNGLAAVSILPLPSDVAPVSLATDRGGHDYVDALGENGRILEYAGTATDPSTPTRDYTVSGSPKLGALTVSPTVPKRIYAVVMPSAGGVANEKIIVLAPGGTTPLRTLGPFPKHYITAMAVDSQGLLYVAMNPVAGGTGSSIRVYAADASGTPTPVRHIFPNPAITEIRGLAIFE